MRAAISLSSRATASNSRNRSSPEPLPPGSPAGASNISGASRTRSGVSPSSPAIPTMSTLADIVRNTWRHGQYGGAPLDSAAGPHAAATPCAAASPVSSSAMRSCRCPARPGTARLEDVQREPTRGAPRGRPARVRDQPIRCASVATPPRQRGRRGPARVGTDPSQTVMPGSNSEQGSATTCATTCDSSTGLAFFLDFNHDRDR